jgi:hypothetical protein
MKAIEAILDIVLLVVLLGAMLSFIPSVSHDLRKDSAWGFEQLDDKTMRVFAGDRVVEEYTSGMSIAYEILVYDYEYNIWRVAP